MSALEPDADEAARELADALESRAVDYAIGGALALAQWGVVRGTFDVDLNLWVDPAQPTGAAELLGHLGCDFRASAVVREFQEKGWAFAQYRGVRVDFYLPTRDFHASVHARRRRRPLLGRDAWFLSAEDLAVFKLILFRTKDRADLEALLVVRGRDFERDYVRACVARDVGDQDVRLSAWREMVEAAEATLRQREQEPGPP